MTDIEDAGVGAAAEAPPPPPSRPPARPVFEAVPDRERRNPFYRWLMHLGLPMGLSLSVHVLILAGATLYTFSVRAQPEIDVGEYAAGLVESADDRLNEAFQWEQQAKLETPEPDRIEELTPDFTRLDPAVDASLEENATPGIGDADGLGEGRFSLLGTGEGAGGTGTGGFGDGMGGSGGRLGQAGIWGLSVAANKIVYVVDFSGSIIVAVDDLKRDLKASVGRLKPFQSFNTIIFYSEGTGGSGRFKSESFAPSLQQATEENRKQFFAWLDKKSPMGETEPLQSVKRALTMHPEAIFFLSDGMFDDSIVTEITNANRGPNAQIWCFVFDEILLGDTSGIPRDTEGARRLKRIADANHGKTKIVTGKDLGRK